MNRPHMMSVLPNFVVPARMLANCNLVKFQDVFNKLSGLITEEVVKKTNAVFTFTLKGTYYLWYCTFLPVPGTGNNGH